VSERYLRLTFSSYLHQPILFSWRPFANKNLARQTNNVFYFPPKRSQTTVDLSCRNDHYDRAHTLTSVWSIFSFTQRISKALWIQNLKPKYRLFQPALICTLSCSLQTHFHWVKSFGSILVWESPAVWPIIVCPCCQTILDNHLRRLLVAPCANP
jgi:hypothetical protein